MTRAAFVIPGDIDLPTGGYAYDRHVLALLPAAGVAAEHVALPESFPTPTDADIAATRERLGALPLDTVLLVDGLALGALPAALLDEVRQPIVALCHHPLALEAGLDPARAAALKRSETEALAYARHVIVTSAMTKRIVADDFAVPATRITVAEPGTDRAARALSYCAEAEPPAVPRLLAVGSIVPRKGYDVLVRALVPLADRAWEVAIAGSDDRSPATTSALIAQIEAAGLTGRVRMLGAVGTDDLDALYRRSDIFLMPSLFEGYGMVLAEAMARGLPIVCTTGGAAAETSPDAAALKVPPGDARAFSDALARLLDDAPLRRGMSNAAWAAGLALPTWDGTARIIADVLKRATP